MTHFILFDYFVWDLKKSRIEMLFTSWMQEMEKVQLNSKQITGELMAAEMKLRLKSSELSKAEKEKEKMINATFEQEQQKDRIKVCA
jgi:Ulp1 family protease